MKNSGGTGFWHETYFRRGGIEAVYLDAPENIGLMAFAPVVPARRPMFGAAARAEKEFPERPVLSEEELYGEPETAWNHQLGDSPLRGVFKAVNPETLRGKRQGWMQSAKFLTLARGGENIPLDVPFFRIPSALTIFSMV